MGIKVECEKCESKEILMDVEIEKNESLFYVKNVEKQP